MHSITTMSYLLHNIMHITQQHHSIITNCSHFLLSPCSHSITTASMHITQHHSTITNFSRILSPCLHSITTANMCNTQHHSVITNYSWVSSPCSHNNNTTANMHITQHTSSLSNKHESQDISWNWSPRHTTHQTNMNHNTLREIDHLVEHHIKQTWITFVKLITLSSTTSNNMKNHTLRVNDHLPSNKHEESHTSRNWSPGFIVHKWWFNGYKSRFSKINRK